MKIKHLAKGKEMMANLGIIDMIFILIENNIHYSSYGFLWGLSTLHLGRPEFLLLLGGKCF